MRILIVGEYSGFAKNLAAGFQELGHEACIVGYGDGWKKIDVGDNGYLFKRYDNFKIGKFVLKRSWIIRELFDFKRVNEMVKSHLGCFDNILIINYEFIRLNYEKWYPYFSMEDLRKMLKVDGKIYLSSCGDDYPTLLYTKKMRYTSFKNIEKSIFLTTRMMKIFRKVCQNIEGVIPVMCGYSDGYRDIASEYDLKIFDTIPLALSLKNIRENNYITDKIIIFHGIRNKMKGSDLILEALKIIEEKYSKEVIVLAKGHIPLNEYLMLLKKSNIIVDQCWGYSYGMNAIYGMAMGKVVLSGNEPECGKEFVRDDIPVVNILPDVADIVRKLEDLILHQERISEIGEKSRQFVENFHEAKNVASQYIKIFNRYDKGFGSSASL